MWPGRLTRPCAPRVSCSSPGTASPPGVRARTRAVAREFFALPAGVKARYATTVGGRGWLHTSEANGYAEGTPTRRT